MEKRSILKIKKNFLAGVSLLIFLLLTVKVVQAIELGGFDVDMAISYTTGVPAMCGALMMLTGKWIRPGVYTVEEFDPDPFLEALDKYGLPRSENHNPELVD